MEQTTDSLQTQSLSWPDPPGAGAWLGVLLVSAVIGFFVGGTPGVVIFLLEPFTGMLCTPVGVGIVGLATFALGAVRLSKQKARAKAERQRTTEALEAIAIGGANCLSPTTLNVPNKVVLVLTRDSFAVYGKQPFIRHFECPLSNLLGVAPLKDYADLPANAIEVTFIEDDKPFLGRFNGLQDLDGEQWADRVMGIKQRGIAG